MKERKEKKKSFIYNVCFFFTFSCVFLERERYVRMSREQTQRNIYKKDEVKEKIFISKLKNFQIGKQMVVFLVFSSERRKREKFQKKNREIERVCVYDDKRESVFSL